MKGRLKERDLLEDPVVDRRVIHGLDQCVVLYCIMVGSRRVMPPDALQPKAYCTNPGL